MQSTHKLKTTTLSNRANDERSKTRVKMEKNTNHCHSFNEMSKVASIPHLENIKSAESDSKNKPRTDIKNSDLCGPPLSRIAVKIILSTSLTYFPVGLWEVGTPINKRRELFIRCLYYDRRKQPQDGTQSMPWTGSVQGTAFVSSRTVALELCQVCVVCQQSFVSYIVSLFPSIVNVHTYIFLSHVLNSWGWLFPIIRDKVLMRYVSLYVFNLLK